MLTISFLPRNSAADTGWPSSADGKASVGNGSPGFSPTGSGLFRAQIGFGFDDCCAEPTTDSKRPIAMEQEVRAERVIGRL